MSSKIFSNSQAPPGADESEGKYDVISSVRGSASNAGRSSSYPERGIKGTHINSHHQQEKGLVPVPTPQREIIWVHPDLVEGQQWTTLTNMKFRAKQKPRLAMWCVLPPGKKKSMSPR